MKLIYVFDAHCSWCFAFSGVMKKIQEKFAADFDFEVISGGMVIDDRSGPLKDLGLPDLLPIYDRIETMTGVQFGKEYREKVGSGELLINSEIPAIALSVFKSHQPKNAISFAHALQDQFFVQAKSVDDDGLYKNLATSFGLDSDAFLEKMKSPAFKEAARYDFALAKQLQVTSFPQVLLQTSDTQFYLIAKGYTDFSTLEGRILQIQENQLAE